VSERPAGPDTKEELHGYLQGAREALLWKLGGLAEYDLRRPLTPTGTNLLGVVKHLASVELGYFGEAFGRPSGEPLPWFAANAESNADMWVTAAEPRDEILGLYQRARAHADETIETFPLDAVGHVPHWPADRSAVTLHHVLVHMIAETARHAGHADIVRELIDGSVGLRPDNHNMPPAEPAWWENYRIRVADAARQADPAGFARPALRQTVLDTTDARELAEFYRRLLGFGYRAGDDVPLDGKPDTHGQDWLVLLDATGAPRLAFQQVAKLPEATWPDGDRPQMMHLDLTVPTTGELDAQHTRALHLGARLLRDDAENLEEPLRVYADPAGHPFCIFVSPAY
jgi:hypothetical protein